VIRIDDVAVGGEGVARSGGKVLFVAGAIPGDIVEVNVVHDGGNWARAELVRIVEASEHRIEPACRHAGRCGGCDWQTAGRTLQAEWKLRLVEGQLRHLGGLEDSPVDGVEAVGEAFGYRNRMDFRNSGGRPALHEPNSRTLVPLEECLLPVGPLQEVFHRIDHLGSVRRLTLRAGVRTGELAAYVVGRPPPGAERRWGIPVRSGDRGHITEVVSGHRFRITGRAFFQVNTAGAERLCELVAAEVGSGRRLVDLYAGGGLFAVTAGERFETVTAVERDPRAVGDLVHNTGGEVEVVEGPVEHVVSDLCGNWDAVVVDPPRSGLDRRVVDAVTRWRPAVVVYVSCDPASFARDARRLVDRGLRLVRVRVVDMFPQTWHVETVARFEG